MPDSKITALASIGTGTDPVNDALVIVDVSDVSPGGMSATGTTKRVSLNNLLASSPTATLASATITGALTIGGATSFPASVINTSGGNPVFTPTASTLFLYSGSSFLSIRNQANTQEIFNLTPSGVYTFGDGAGSTRMTLNATGLAIGDVPFAGTRLTLRESASQPNALAMTNRNATQTWRIGVDVSAVDDKILGFYDSTSATFRMQLTDTGNLGIGVAPKTWYTSFGTKAVQFAASGALFGLDVDSSDRRVGLLNNDYIDAGGNDKYINNGHATKYQQASGVHSWLTAPSGTAGNSVIFTQAMTLDASSSLMVNTATVLDAAHLTVACTAASGAKTPLSLKVGVDSAGYVAVSLRNQTAVQGTIVVDVTGARYLTASDYRLKNVLGPISGGLARVNALKPSIYKWKADGSTGEGFIAHELAEVVPAAVNGAKDAVNEDGTINPQNVDMSRIVPILVAAIQELAAEVNALKNA